MLIICIWSGCTKTVGMSSQYADCLMFRMCNVGRVVARSVSVARALDMVFQHLPLSSATAEVNSDVVLPLSSATAEIYELNMAFQLMESPSSASTPLRLLEVCFCLVFGACKTWYSHLCEDYGFQ
ncbi:hypothetical protein B0H11DRAFT_1902412 [Mycena galericulata]|nr:hypothetical protein B0H11DRAFT_1902412 [Mycena galericulata]